MLTDGERIVAIGELAGRAGDVEVIDAAGLHVLPGFIDVHVHVGEAIGGREPADDFASASALAIRNGITTLAVFATQRPGESLTATAHRLLGVGLGHSSCDFAVHLTPTQWPWNWDEVARLVAAGFRTFKLYTTYRAAGLYTGYDRLAEVVPRLAALGARLLLHCEDDGALGAVDPRSVELADPFSHTLLRPAHAEVCAIERVLELAGRTDCPVHVVHVSTAEGAERIAAARASGAPVTCETAPHYLLLDEEALREPDGHRLLCTPPLRPPATRARLEALAAGGAIDLFATDHCAFRKADKDAWSGTDIREVPSGLAGLGALVPLSFELLVGRHRLPLGELALRLSANPARVLGAWPRKGVIRVGGDADLALIDPYGPPHPVVSTLAGAHDPWTGRASTLAVRHVLLRGEPVVRDGSLLPRPRPAGRPLAAPC